MDKFQCLRWMISALLSLHQDDGGSSLLAWMAFLLHKGSELVKVESNQAVNQVLMLATFRSGGLVASKLLILVACDDLPAS